MSKRAFGSPEMYSNESADTRGTELEKAYAEHLGCIVVGRIGDRGVDLICKTEPGVPIIQVKGSIEHTEEFLMKSLNKLEYIPIVVGDFLQDSKEIIFEAVRKNGCYVGDVPNREKFSKKIMDMRDYILSHGGRQKLYQ
ncbi:MAG: hypothetical protein WCK03_02815 [Candidatus Taylorbacteria bacterium]